MLTFSHMDVFIVNVGHRWGAVRCTMEMGSSHVEARFSSFRTPKILFLPNLFHIVKFEYRKVDIFYGMSLSMFFLKNVYFEICSFPLKSQVPTPLDCDYPPYYAKVLFLHTKNYFAHKNVLFCLSTLLCKGAFSHTYPSLSAYIFLF